MKLLCQFCEQETDGRVRFSRGWCCWYCLDKYGIEDDPLTSYLMDGYHPVRQLVEVKIELIGNEL